MKRRLTGLAVIGVVCSALTSHLFAARAAVSGAEVTGTFRAYFKGAPKATYYSEIQIQALGHQKLKIQMDLVDPFKPPSGEWTANLGSASGEAVIMGDMATFVIGPEGSYQSGCKMLLHFARPGHLVVTTQGRLEGADCGFGMHLAADGIYKKVSAALPKFEENH